MSLSAGFFIFTRVVHVRLHLGSNIHQHHLSLNKQADKQAGWEQMGVKALKFLCQANIAQTERASGVEGEGVWWGKGNVKRRCVWKSEKEDEEEGLDESVWRGKIEIYDDELGVWWRIRIIIRILMGIVAKG